MCRWSKGASSRRFLLLIGVLDFGKDLLAKCAVSLLRTRGEHKSLVGEFAFPAKSDDRESVGAK